jgi:hypothetical protein
MNETEITEVLQPPPDGGAEVTYKPCDHCGAPTDQDQRYCVVCGAQLRNASDPAARYFNKAAGRSRAQTATPPVTGSRPSASRWGGLGVALMLALIPAAAAIGVEVGRSSNNGDTQLIHALARHQGTVTVSGAPTTAASQTAAAATTKHAKASKHVASPKTSSTKSTPTTKGGGKVLSKTSNGSAQQISGFKATKSDEQQGAKATQQVQKSTGKSYVNQQSSLPSQVVVP